MYSIQDIRQIAIQIERNGERTYRTAGENADDPELAKLLIWMADEERRHAEWFETLSSDASVTPEHSDMEAMGRALLQEMVGQQTFSLEAGKLRDAGHVEELLTQSLEFEKDTILFYKMLKSFIDDEHTTAQLNQIVDEEQGHILLLKRMKKRYAEGASEENTSCGNWRSRW